MNFSEKKGVPAVRVALVNPNDEIRALLRMKFSRDSRFSIAGEFSNTREAIQSIEATRPEAVVVDLSENLSGGLDLITLIKLGNPSCRVLVISGFPGDGLGPAAVRRGADAFIPSGSRLSDIAEKLAAIGKQETAGPTVVSCARRLQRALAF